MDIKEKEDFKAAFRNTDAFTLNFGGNEFAFKLNASGEFYYSEVRSAWKIWQAAKAQAVSEGYVLMPKEPTPKMIDATWDFNDEIQEMSHNTRNEFIYKTMIKAQEQK